MIDTVMEAAKGMPHQLLQQGRSATYLSIYSIGFVLNQTSSPKLRMARHVSALVYPCRLSELLYTRLGMQSTRRGLVTRKWVRTTPTWIPRQPSSGGPHRKQPYITQSANGRTQATIFFSGHDCVAQYFCLFMFDRQLGSYPGRCYIAARARYEVIQSQCMSHTIHLSLISFN